jgi:UDP-N-acetylglucosamine transferase subunit ALG13
MRGRRGGTPLVFVTVGTDHHPFTRLTESIARWPARAMASVVVQHGTAPPVPGTECHRLLDSSDMDHWLRTADAVVCAAGPGTVMGARRAGIRPVVVPRRAAGGEHVDDHQHAFGRHLEANGLAFVVDTGEPLFAALDRLFIDLDAYRIAPDPGTPAGIARTGAAIDALIRGRA